MARIEFCKDDNHVILHDVLIWNIDNVSGRVVKDASSVTFSEARFERHIDLNFNNNNIVGEIIDKRIDYLNKKVFATILLFDLRWINQVPAIGGYCIDHSVENFQLTRCSLVISNADRNVKSLEEQIENTEFTAKQLFLLQKYSLHRFKNIVDESIPTA